jgi:hypothetical protein
MRLLEVTMGVTANLELATSLTKVGVSHFNSMVSGPLICDVDSAASTLLPLLLETLLVIEAVP